MVTNILLSLQKYIIMDYSKYKYVGVKCLTSDQWDEVYKSLGMQNYTKFSPSDYIVIAARYKGDIGARIYLLEDDRLMLTYTEWKAHSSGDSSMPIKFLTTKRININIS